jgi:hypothetical protein
MLKFDAKRIAEQTTLPGLSSTPLDNGDQVQLIAVEQGDIKTKRDGKDVEISADRVIAQIKRKDGTKDEIRIPMREITKMRDTENSRITASEKDQEEASIESEFTVVAVTDRTRDGKLVYPIAAYKNAQLLYQGTQDYNEVVEAGLQPMDGDGYPGGVKPLRNYVVKVG